VKRSLESKKRGGSAHRIDTAGEPLFTRNGTIELPELVAHVQDQLPKLSAKLNGRGRAAIAVSGSTVDRQRASGREAKISCSRDDRNRRFPSRKSHPTNESPR
jgi:hypothetical protein